MEGVCMKINELMVKEEPVMSSWISDVTLQNNGRDITMTLGNGKRYVIRGAGPAQHTAWMRAPSKGQYWHQNVKNRFTVTRVM